MTIRFSESQVNDGDGLVLKFEDVIYNGRETIIDAEERITYTK